MLDKGYIRTLKLQGFKSFRSAEAEFPEGFSCVAGPNGSGKSNIIDAIRFALGESSLKALRCKQTSDLINSNCKLAQVTICMGGGLEITRAINREGKTLCRMNGKRSTHTMVMKELQKRGICSSGAITQEHVQRMVEMEPAARLQMIGELAGAAELDSKFDEAKLGLCRIEREITEASIRLGEREGFLKELEKDKGETLTYLSAQADFKRACKSSDKKLMEKSTEVMGALGAVNLKAPELYEQKKKEISGLKSSITSLAAEQKSVLEGMEKSEARKRAAFLSVFKEVDKNFRKLSANIFHGDARLALENPSDPFEGDLLVELRADGHNRRIEDMPSGEKPLLALILLLAMRMHKAVPFYILDEADAALDRENSAKLAALLRRLSGITQFIAITHNDTLISAAETTLGVMRTDDGSKMVGMEKRG